MTALQRGRPAERPLGHAANGPHEKREEWPESDAGAAQETEHDHDQGNDEQEMN
jgi:hypothetical protein